MDLKIAPGGGYLAALLDYFNSDGAATVSTLILADPEGVMSRVEMPHSGGRLAFSPDGDNLAVSVQAVDEGGESFGGVAIYDVSDPKAPVLTQPLRELSRPGFVRMTFGNADTLHYLKQEAEGRIRRWNIRTGAVTETAIRLGPDGSRPYAINCVETHSGGDLFIAGQWEFVVRWRDRGDHQERVWVDQVNGAVAFRDIALSHDHRYLAGGTSDSRCVIWNAETGERWAELPHLEMVERVRFSPDDPGLLATMTAAGTVVLWDWKAGKPIAEPIDGGERLSSMAFSPDGKRVLVGQGGIARMWSTIPRLWETRTVDLGSPLDAVSFTGHGSRFVATSHASETAFLGEGLSGKPLASWPHRTLYSHDRKQNRFPAITNRIANHVVTADSPRLLKIRFPAPASDREPLEIVLNTDATAITTTPDGRFLAVGDAEHETRVFDLSPEEGGAPRAVAMVKGVGLSEWELKDWRQRYPERDGRFDNFVSRLVFSPNASRLVVTESPLGAVIAWNWREQTQIGRDTMLLEDYIADLQTTRNNRFALVGGDCFSVWSLNLDTGMEAGLRRLHRTPVTQLRITQDSKRLVTGTAGGEVLFWDLEDNRSRPTSRFQAGTAPILSMEMDEESVVCATGDAAGKIHLWLVGSGQPLCDTLDTGGAAVNDLAFHHRLPLLAAACEDGKVRLWEIPTGRGRAPHLLSATAESLACLYFADDGSVKRGALFYHDTEIGTVAKMHREHREARERSPDMLPGEYQRLIFDIHGLPAIEPPVWLVPDEQASP